MRGLFVDCLEAMQAEALEREKKRAIARQNVVNMFEGSPKNSIFHQKNYIKLKPSEVEAVKAALYQLEAAAKNLASARAALEFFEHIEKRELGLSLSFVDGFIYMLDEFLTQNEKRGVKP